MSTSTRTDAAFTPASLGAVVPQSRKANPVPVRLSFETWGRRRLGDPDPDAPGYQILDGWMVYALRGDERPPVAHFRDVSGRNFIIAPGHHFRSTGEIPEGLESEFSLSEYTDVVGKRRASGDGYVPVAVNPVFLKPD